jgi:rhodanese-related sulfurtransferase
LQNVDVRSAHQKQAEGYTYVDVRSVPEFTHGHPAGAVNVPLMHKDSRTGQMTPNADFIPVMRANFPTNAKLLIGCQAGARSAQAAMLLESAGYTDVSNVLGGFGGARDPVTGAMRAEGWMPAGLPIETATEGRAYDDLRKRTTEAR